MSRVQIQIEDAMTAIRHFEEIVEVPRWLQRCYEDTEHAFDFKFRDFNLECLFGVKRVYGKDKKIVNGKEKGYFYVLERCVVIPKAGLTADEARYVRTTFEL